MTRSSTARRLPPIDRLAAFVSGPRLVSEDGRILSWLNQDHVGYPYDEATALFARLYAWQGNARASARTGRVLEELISHRGWLGRDGVDYVFDTALAIPSLIAPEPVVQRVLAWLTAEKVCAPVTRPGWWSQSYGAHLLKALVPVARHGRRLLAQELARDLVERTFDGERFRIHDQSHWTYVHSHCYAVEGLLGLGMHPDVVRAASDWLAKLQSDDGSLPAWVGGISQPPPADVVAQSVRIWAVVDPEAYAVPIARGLARLDALQHPATGGIEYAEGSGDINSWASAFALQARLWVRNQPTDKELEWLL